MTENLYNRRYSKDEAVQFLKECLQKQRSSLIYGYSDELKKCMQSSLTTWCRFQIAGTELIVA